MSNPVYNDTGSRRGHSYPNYRGDDDGGGCYQELSGYAQYRPPTGATMSYLTPQGTFNSGYLNMLRTANMRVTPVRFGYDTLTGESQSSGASFFPLQKAYTPR